MPDTFGECVERVIKLKGERRRDKEYGRRGRKWDEGQGEINKERRTMGEAEVTLSANDRKRKEVVE